MKNVLAGLAAFALLAVFAGCDLDVPEARDEYHVSTADEWNAAIREINRGPTAGTGRTHTIYVEGAIAVPGINISGYNLVLRSPGTLTPSNDDELFYIHDGNLTLNGPTLTCDPENQQRLIYVGSEGSFIMENGAIRDASEAVSINAGGSFVMNGGTISGMASGAVSSYGSFTMNGGTIRDNADTGVKVFAGTFPVEGGLTLTANGSFTMNGGTISDNTASWGGGVYIDRGSFTMKAGTLSGNTASMGGGVYVGGEGASFTLEDGTITGNSALGSLDTYGGGVFVEGGNASFTMKGGTITGNAANRGGGVAVLSPGVFTKTGGVIAGSDAASGKNIASYGDTNGHAAFLYGSFVGGADNYYCDASLPGGVPVDTLVPTGPWTKK